MKVALYSAVETVDGVAVAALTKIERNLDFLIDFEMLPDEEKEKSRAVATFSLGLCEDDAFNRVVVNCEKGNWYEAWRRLCRSKCARSVAGALTALMHATFTFVDPRMRRQQWDREATTYEQRFGEALPDALRRSTYQTKVAPTELHKHLLLRVEKIPTAIDVADEI